MIYIPIFIIIVILGLDLHFTYSNRFGKTSSEKFKNEDEEETIFENPNPWNKVQYYTHYNRYFIKINNLNDHVEKIMLWKSLPIIKSDMIDIDIDNNFLILKAYSEEEALVVCNLIINHINNNLTINDIVSKNLINYSINKAKRFKLIGIKLTELIKDGLAELNGESNNEEHLDYTDTDNDDGEEIKIKIIKKVKINEPNKKTDRFVNNNVKELKKGLFDRIEPYEGSEYASINF
jgi:hypothetical protein